MNLILFYEIVEVVELPESLPLFFFVGTLDFYRFSKIKIFQPKNRYENKKL